MLYDLLSAIGFAALYGEAAWARSPDSALPVALVAFVGVLISLSLPPRFSPYTNEDIAPTVLTRLMQRGAVGSALMLLVTLLAWLLIARPDDPVLLGELYVMAALGIFLFQGWSQVVTRHVMYLQQTSQYNSNQLTAVLLMVTLLLFTLILYFLAFDLARAPQLHAYRRDLLAISLTLLGHARAVYLMAHH